MADTTANGPTGTYDEWARSAVDPGNSDGSAVDGTGDRQMSFRLEIVLVSGREGEKFQAIQARAIREALLWVARREDNRNSPGEGGDDGPND